MLPTTLKDFLMLRFPEEVTKALVYQIQHAYDENTDLHDPSIGHDEMLFGLALSKSTKYFINNLAELEPWLEIKKRAPQFIFSINGLRMSAYRVGNPTEMDPSVSFPSNHGGACLLAKENKQRSFDEIWLPEDENWDDQNLRRLILAYRGNYKTGLTQVFLGVPEDIDKEKNIINKWEETLVLWQRDGEDQFQISLPEDNPPPKVPTETIAPPQLSRRKVAKAGGNE